MWRPGRTPTWKEVEPDTSKPWLTHPTKTHIPLSTTSARIMPILKRVLRKLRFCGPSGDEKASRDIKLTQTVRRSPTPPSAASEVELAKQRTECARLEREYEKIKAKADVFADAKGKLEDELREVKELLEARGKEIGQKDTSIQRLENEMGTKVSRGGSGTGFDG